MRPNRTIVIGHWIISRLVLGDRPNSPPREEIRRDHRVGDPAGAIWGRYPRPQKMTGIGSPHPTSALCSVERNRIETHILAPERLLESDRQIIRCSIEFRRRFMLTQASRTSRRRSLCGIGVALDLAQGDRTLRQFSVRMEDRVEGVFPPLIAQAVAQPAVAAPAVFEKSVTIRIAERIHPAQRLFDGRPQLAQRGFVTGAFDIKSNQDHEERRRIDSAIVETKRHLVQRGHFAAAHFVQDLARFRVP